MTINSFRPQTRRGSDTKAELDTNINLSSHFHDLGEVNCLGRSFLQIGDGENLEARVIDLFPKLASDIFL